MIDLDTLSIVLTGIGIIVAIIYYTLTLRNTSKARQRELILQRFQGYSFEYMEAFVDVENFTDWEDSNDFLEKYGPEKNPEAFSKYLYTMSIYNLAGVFLKEKIADAELIFQLYQPNTIIGMWEKFEPLTLALRERRKYPEYREPFEFLYNEAKKRYPEIQESFKVFQRFV